MYRVTSIVLACTVHAGQQPSPKVRRLIVKDGPNPDLLSTYPFAVAIMSCTSGSGGSLLCAQFCSGSLITPDVVISAGHCVHSKSSPYGTSRPPVLLSRMYALLGSGSGGQRLVKISSVVNKGYGLNKRYEIDNDVSLLFLSECVDLVPNQIAIVKVATLDDEWPTPTGCHTVNAVGFGRTTNLPSEIAVSDGRLRAISDVAHSYDTCIDSYVEASMELEGYTAESLDDPNNSNLKAFYYSFFTPEETVCVGGNTVHSSCNGDSGGGIVAGTGDEARLIGVTSFGVGAFCGYGSDYITRLAGMGPWIRNQIQETSLSCSGDSTVLSSARDFRPDELSTVYNQTRCGAGQWQCGNGPCIATAKVCDRTSDCSDNSDEGSAFCGSLYSRTARVRGALPDVDALTDEQAASEAELAALISGQQAHIDSKVKEWHNRKAGGRSLSEGAGQVIIVGQLTTVGRPVPGLPSELADELATAMTTSQPAEPHMKGQPSRVFSEPVLKRDCSSESTALTNVITEEKSVGNNRAEFAPSTVVNACNDYTQCIAGTAATSLTSFCDSMASFMSDRAAAYAMVDTFDTKYNGTCPVPLSAETTENPDLIQATSPIPDSGTNSVSNGVSTSAPREVSGCRSGDCSGDTTSDMRIMTYATICVLLAIHIIS